MERIIILLILTYLLTSCKKGDNKSDFIGNWSTISGIDPGIRDLQFFNDSVIQKSSYDSYYSTKWKVEKKKLIFYREYGSLQGRKVSLDFKFKKDTLYLKFENDSTYYIILKKIKSAYEYFENKIGLEIELAKADKETTLIGKNKLNFNIYISRKNGKLIAKNDYSQNLDRLALDIFSLLDKIPEKEQQHLQYTLFIDKNISKQKVDSIKSLLLTDITNKVFIVTDFKENNWNEDISWIGFYEK